MLLLQKTVKAAFFHSGFLARYLTIDVLSFLMRSNNVFIFKSAVYDLHFLSVLHVCLKLMESGVGTQKFKGK